MKKVVHSMGFEPLNCCAKKLANKGSVFISCIISKTRDFKSRYLKQGRGFSLVEMLMALLVASLLLAALAPVMTKRMDESGINISGIGSGVRSDYSREFYEDFEWTVPGGVNLINITAVGGGGAGGGASYGYKEITSSESNWIVPEGVTRLRVFMTGAGGGGASGGLNSNYVQVRGREDGKTYKDFLSTGETSFTMTNRTVPALDSKCAASGDTQWTEVSDGTTKYTPNEKIQTKVTACGGGGGGTGGHGYGGVGGGSGGYVVEKKFNSGSDSLKIRIGEGGNGGANLGWVSVSSFTVYQGAKGGSGFGGTYSGAGGFWGRYDSVTAGNGGMHYIDSDSGGDGGSGYGNGTIVATAAGGGGGGATSILANNSLVFQIGGGGGAGGSAFGYSSHTYGGGGGSGGGIGAGCGGGGVYQKGNEILHIGGGGGGGVENGTCTAGGGASHTADGSNGGTGAVLSRGKDGTRDTKDAYYYDSTKGIIGVRGGAGGGGFGGVGGGYAINNINAEPAVIPDCIFDNTKYCSGGHMARTGKPGALRLYYTYPPLKCEYHLATNSGGGGGAGQIWIGEIDVVPGQKINFNVGLGGDKTRAYSVNGNDGGSTSIVVNGNTYSVSGGKGGKYEDDDTYIANSGGLGGGVKTSNFDSKARYVNWLNLTNLDNGGLKGFQGNPVSGGAGGGGGGNTIAKDGKILTGASSVNMQTNGNDAISTNYGVGGSGGGGAGVKLNQNPGFGGKGANGYIYIEWGNANGGGGATGQVAVKKSIWVSAGTKIKINIGKGGESKPVLNTLNGVSGYFGQDGNDGGDTYVTTSEGEAIRAKGGLGGKCGRTDHGRGGNYYEIDSDGNPVSGSSYMKNSIKGEDGSDEYGGAGGSITETLCPLITSLNGLGGCGGNMPNGNCANSSSTAIGKNASKIGGGGGGGAVKDNAAYQGGRGANGMVVIEWSN